MADKEVSNPTYMADIRHFFTPGDKKCMAGFGIDLATYHGVVFNALRIFFKVRDGEMPLGAPPWSTARVETFYNWMKNGYERGFAVPKRPTAPVKTDPRFSRPPAKRDDAAKLKGKPLELLKTAFQGMLDKDPADPDSFFALAGVHWLPTPDVYCRHHENAYNPWHRVYLNKFEDALRRVPGCENVSLPYWDITSNTIPDFLFSAPFDSYVFPRDLVNLEGDTVVKKGDRTVRRKPKEILAQLKSRDVTGLINGALGNCHWEQFNGWDAGNTQKGIISAHDNGHNACGPTMQSQDIAAFDPIFWFFHCNWDRLWWQWQRSYGAITLDTFKTHLAGPSDWLDDPTVNELPPFGLTSADTINLANFDVTYGTPKAAMDKITAQPLKAGAMMANKAFEIDDTKRASLRVKDVDRLKIPGSFDVVLEVKGKEIGRKAFFQSTTPVKCENCRKKAISHFDFEVNVSALDGPVTVKILLLRNGREINFPLSSCGNPTVNARLLLS